MNKRETADMEYLRIDNERLKRQLSAAHERSNLYGRMVEILSERLKLTDDELDDVRRKAKE